jgi:hypothetical protein
MLLYMGWADISLPSTETYSHLSKRLVSIQAILVEKLLCSCKTKNGLANFILYFTTCATIKASLLLLYYRYFGISKPFRWALYVCSAIIACWYVAVFFGTIFQCTPVSAFWDRTMRNRKCVDVVHFPVGSGITNLLTDIMILCLPIPMVWTLHTNRAQKWTLTGIFFLDFL